MVLFNKIIGQKRKTGISCHVFSFQQSLSFVERFVEKKHFNPFYHGFLHIYKSQGNRTKFNFLKSTISLLFKDYHIYI